MAVLAELYKLLGICIGLFSGQVSLKGLTFLSAYDLGCHMLNLMPQTPPSVEKKRELTDRETEATTFLYRGVEDLLQPVV